MIDNEIVKAYEQCILHRTCSKKCAYFNKRSCKDIMIRDVNNLINHILDKNKKLDEKIIMYKGTIDWQAKEINRQKAEIERLKEERDAMHRDVITAEEYAWKLNEKLKISKSEAIKEIAEKFKEKAGSIVTSCQGYEIYETKQYQISAINFDNLVKEMTEQS